MFNLKLSRYFFIPITWNSGIGVYLYNPDFEKGL
jgi:hypothetical protein